MDSFFLPGDLLNMPGSVALPPSPPSASQTNGRTQQPAVRFLHTECNEELFCPQYIRNNKATGHKNLRCFPHCCQGHKSRSYCGSSLTVACADVSCEYVFGRFELEHRSASASAASHNPEDETDSVRVGDVRRLRDFRTLIKTKNNPLASWMQGTELCKDESMKLFEVNENRISWHYGYVSNRFSTDATHVFRVYFFKRCSLDNDEIECIASIASTPFRLVSSRQIRKEAQPVAPSILSLVDLDKISDDRFDYMQRASNLVVVQTVLMNIGEFERVASSPHGFSLASLTFRRPTKATSSSQSDLVPFKSLLPPTATARDEERATTALSLLISFVDRVLADDFALKIQGVLAALASCVSSAPKLNKAYGGFIEMLEMQIFTYLDKTMLGLPPATLPTLNGPAVVVHLVRFLRSSLPLACFVAADDDESLTGITLPQANGQSLHALSQEPPYFVALVAQLRLKFQQSLLQRTPLPTVNSGGKQQYVKWRRVDSNRSQFPIFVMREYSFYMAQRIEVVSSESELQTYLPNSLVPVWNTFILSGEPLRPTAGHMGISSHVGFNGRTAVAYRAWREGSRVTIQLYYWPMHPSLTRIRLTRHIQLDPTRSHDNDRLMITNELEMANHDPICPPVDADIHAQLNYPATYFPHRKYTEYYERDVVAKKRKAVEKIEL
ncbi:Aste57867_10870 [Aphanomyces stellatus]|uniref:Aste57867_10870 protein n=1 Tax=Aphanomyces stellatus TaxID=120398 RepID=A0A485KRG2_9STRA|nr:hypothetical protein As57867_010830 [Aphanomyces stellatus]VFT87738.1 Aste57867_10870 [Aphanomyces stellatus]